MKSAYRINPVFFGRFASAHCEQSNSDPKQTKKEKKPDANLVRLVFLD